MPLIKTTQDEKPKKPKFMRFGFQFRIKDTNFFIGFEIKDKNYSTDSGEPFDFV